MTERGQLDQVAARLAAILGIEDCLLIGALAVAAHGHVRATDDVDLLCRVNLETAQARLRKEGIRSELRKGDPLEGDFPCIRGVLQGVEFDIIPPLVPLEWDLGIDLRLEGGGRLRVVNLEGLLRLKFRAGGPQDLVDVAMLVLLHPKTRKRALDLAEAHGSASTLRDWLDDPRLKSKARPRRSP